MGHNTAGIPLSLLFAPSNESADPVLRYITIISLFLLSVYLFVVILEKVGGLIRSLVSTTMVILYKACTWIFSLLVIICTIAFLLAVAFCMWSQRDTFKVVAEMAKRVTPARLWEGVGKDLWYIDWDFPWL